MAYGDFKDLTRRTASDKILCGKAFNVAKNLKRLASRVYNFLLKNLLVLPLRLHVQRP